jgi:hypothetical protein
MGAPKDLNLIYVVERDIFYKTVSQFLDDLWFLKEQGKTRFWHPIDEIVYLRIGGIYKKYETWFCSLCRVN